MSLSSVLLYALYAVLGLGFFLALYGFTQDGTVQEPRGAKFRTTKQVVKDVLFSILISPVYVFGLGIFGVIVGTLIAGPTLLSLYVFHWPYGISLGIGIPSGIALIVGAYALTFGRQKN